MAFHFKLKYFTVTLLLLLVEIAIAIYVHDKIIRPYIGDVLVVILIYCFVKAFVNISVTKAAIGVLLFSFVIETSQYFNVVQHLGLQHNKLATVIIGNSFSWIDMLCYMVGIGLVLIVERMSNN